MRAWSLFLCACAPLVLAVAAFAQEPGVSATLARERASRVSNVRYELSFSIPNDKAAVINGHEIVTFTLRDTTRPLLVDFEPASSRRVRTVTVGLQRLEP